MVLTVAGIMIGCRVCAVLVFIIADAISRAL